MSVVPLEQSPHAPDLFHAYRHWAAAPGVERRPGGWEYQGRFYPDYLFVGGASFAIHRQALKHCRGTGADIGAGLWPLPGAQPIDLERGPGAGQGLETLPEGSLDYIFSSHCLEHIVDWRGSLAQWGRKLKAGGRLFLYLPHPDCAIWHPGSPFVGDGHKWKPTPLVVRQALAELGGHVVDADDGPDAMQSFYVCAVFGLAPRYPVI